MQTALITKSLKKTERFGAARRKVHDTMAFGHIPCKAAILKSHVAATEAARRNSLKNPTEKYGP
jgi:hypothetical protein